MLPVKSYYWTMLACRELLMYTVPCCTKLVPRSCTAAPCTKLSKDMHIAQTPHREAAPRQTLTIMSQCSNLQVFLNEGTFPRDFFWYLLGRRMLQA